MEQENKSGLNPGLSDGEEAQHNSLQMVTLQF